MKAVKRMTVLVVDDNNVNTMLVRKILTKQGYSVESASNGMEALEKIKKWIPDLILLDIMMPTMDGYETCRRIKEDKRSREIPILFLSALDETDAILKGFEAGGVDYVPKPFEPQELLARVNAHISLAQMSRENRLYAQEMEALAQERANALVHADRLITLGILSAGVAHEINNPVTAISVSIQTFELLWEEIKSLIEEENRKSDTKWREIDTELINDLIESIHNGVRRVNSITRAMKGYARKGDNLSESCSIHDAIEQGLKLCSNRLKYNISVEKNYAENMPKILINRQKFEQVVINLVINAADAMEDHGRLFISTSYDEKNVYVKIADTGSGIPPGMLDRIWEPFITTKSPEKGTGLGLSIVRGILKEYSGSIVVENNALGGAQFTISLPNRGENDE